MKIIYNTLLMNAIRRGILYIILFITIQPAFAIQDNLNFNGNLVRNPCNLETTAIDVDFGTIVEKLFYLHGRTTGTPFYIKLTDCDASQSSLITFTFSGVESNALPGLIETTGTAGGIAVGIETYLGIPLPVNLPGTPYTFNGGTNTFEFKAYVQGEPDAIQNESIRRGPFSATATFEISYL